jgi:hypothetical protein
MQRTDLLAKHGPEKVMSAIDEVADFVGDVDEIGSSDVSGWVRQVEQMLGNMKQGMAEGSTTRGGFGGSAGQAQHEIEWLKKKISSLPPTKDKQIRDLQRQIRERELAIAFQKEGVAEADDPINYNAAITGSYYESQDPLARIKSLALRK